MLTNNTQYCATSDVLTITINSYFSHYLPSK